MFVLQARPASCHLTFPSQRTAAKDAAGIVLTGPFLAASHSNRRLDRRMIPVVHKFEVFHAIVEDRRRLSPDY